VKRDGEKVFYTQEWPEKKELGFIEGIGMERVLDEGGKFVGLKQIKPKEYIIACLKGYLKGAYMKDWTRAGLDGDRCIGAAKDRLATLGGGK
jgi:hypothetical protein